MECLNTKIFFLAEVQAHIFKKLYFLSLSFSHFVFAFPVIDAHNKTLGKKTNPTKRSKSMILLQMAPLGILGTLPSACVWDCYLNTCFLMTKINGFFKEGTLGARGMQTLKCLLVCACLWKTNKHIYKFMSSYLILWVGDGGMVLTRIFKLMCPNETHPVSLCKFTYKFWSKTDWNLQIYLYGL